MKSADLAKLLVESTPEARNSLILEHDPFDAAAIAESLQTMCYEVWTEDPKAVYAIADTLKFIANHSQSHEVLAYSEWVNAIQALVGGELEKCINYLESSEAIFASLGKPHLAAKTQTSKLYALALLGRYDEAVECGKRALQIFVKHEDIYSAGKIEHNIGNLFWRRDLYRESEPYLESARRRFLEIDDQRQLAMVENCQAFVKTLQNQFREAERIYAQALDRAGASELSVTEAEIETGLSNLYLFQGRYDQALKFMEKSRQKYDSLQMPNQSANCELEIADIYLELNLLPEAIEFYKKVEGKFRESGMQGELARSCLNHARAAVLLGETDGALKLLDRAETLYKDEGNSVAAASAKLVRAQILLHSGQPNDAETEVREALDSFEKGGNLRFALFARWLLGEAALINGNRKIACDSLEALLSAARDESHTITYLCLVSLGRATGKADYFRDAVKIAENLRSALSSSEFRTSFFSDKITPYNELIKLELAAGNTKEALSWHERSRSRTLLEEIKGPPADAHANAKLIEIREELNWFYSRINRQTETGFEARGEIATLRKLALEKEKSYAEMLRRMPAGVALADRDHGWVDILGIQKYLADTTVVEFVLIDGMISVFLISGDGLSAVTNYADEKTINQEIKQLLFQIKTARFFHHLSEANREIANLRLMRHSQRLYDLLIRPISDRIKGGRVVFVPAGLLHYLPFQSLNDGRVFLIEDFEISYAPSVSILQNCLSAPQLKRRNALLAAVADKFTPLVDEEVAIISQLFEVSTCLMNSDATIANINHQIRDADVIHIACHGTFRQDNPGFSSLSLYDENLTINEIRGMKLQDRMIVLSACESGVNDVVKGEELIGLTRGLLEAGSRTLVQSLWNVSDRWTLELMKTFYEEFIQGQGPAVALRVAQRRLIGEKVPPYLWSPFVVTGGW